MKIALLSTPWLKLPPQGYGGTETVVYELSEGLVKKGHDVFVFATGDSQISSKLLWFYKEQLGINALLDKAHLHFALTHIYKALQSFPKNVDIIHNHCEYPAMYLLDHHPKSFLHTLHGAFYSNYTKDQQAKNAYTEAIRQTLKLFKHHPFVSISNSQRKGMLDLNYVATVYNGIKIQQFTFNEKGGEIIKWLGRFSPIKGLDIAIKVSKNLKKRLVFAAFINKNRQDTFDTQIKPSIDNYLITYRGQIESISEKDRFLGETKLFLFPIQWEEPFGLVMIESMACGTPVVAFARGSVPEVVKDGETGFIVNPSDDDIRGNWIIKKTGIEGLCEAVERIYSMPEEQYRQMRKNCRAHVEKHFTVERMVEEYEKVYQEIINTKKH